MAVLFQRIASLPPARGLMVWARREGYIDLLLSGLENGDIGVQAQTVRTVLLAYYQKQGMSLQKAAEMINSLPSLPVDKLTTALKTLSVNYNWK